MIYTCDYHVYLHTLSPSKTGVIHKLWHENLSTIYMPYATLHCIFFQIFNFIVWIQLQFKSKHVYHYIKWLNESLGVRVLWRHHRNHGIILKISWKKFLKNKVPLYPPLFTRLITCPINVFCFLAFLSFHHFHRIQKKKYLRKLVQ